MHISVKSEDDRTDYAVHSPAFQCTVHHPRQKYEFFSLSDRIEPHVQLRLFLDRKTLEELRDRITAILNVDDATKSFVDGRQLELASV